MRRVLSACILLLGLAHTIAFGQNDPNVLHPIMESLYDVDDSIRFVIRSSSPGDSIELSSSAGFTPSTRVDVSSGETLIAASDRPVGRTFWRLVSAGVPTGRTMVFDVVDIDSSHHIIFRLDAGDGPQTSGGGLDRWNNRTDTALHAVQPDAAFRPDLQNGVLNERPAVRFGSSGTTFLEHEPIQVMDTNYTVFIFYRQVDNPTPLGYILGYSDSILLGGIHGDGSSGSFNNFGAFYNTTPTRFLRMTTPEDFEWHIRMQMHNRIFEDGDRVFSLTGGSVPLFASNAIGTRLNLPNALYFDGWIGDIIICDQRLAPSDRISIERYIQTKYTPYPDLGPDTVVCGPSFRLGIPTDNSYSRIEWSTGAVGPDSITATQSGWYWVEVNSFGWTIRDSVFLDGLVPQPALSHEADTVLCVGDSLVVDVTNMLPGFQYTWMDGRDSSSIVVRSEGSVFVDAADSAGCSASSDTFFLDIDSFSVQSTLGPDRTECLNANVEVFSTSQGNAPYQGSVWSTGETTSSITLDSAGANQIIDVEVVDFYGCVFRDTVEIDVLDRTAPVVDFTYDTVCPFSATTFSDVTVADPTDPIIDRTWVFESMDTAVGPATTYDPGRPGPFDARFTIRTDSGCVNSVLRTIIQHQQPSAQTTPTIVCAGSASGLVSASTIAAPDSIDQFIWRSAVDTTTGPIADLVFPVSGPDTVIHEVITDQGCTDQDTVAVEVFPAIDVSFEVQNTCLGDTVTFLNTSESLSVVEWLWTFGDGSGPSVVPEPTHVYDDADTFTVELTVENAIGCRRTIGEDVAIRPPLNPQVDPDTVCADAPVQLTAVASDSLVDVAWAVDGDTLAGPVLEPGFAPPGRIGVVVDVVSQAGCTASALDSITILPPPDLTIDVDPDFGEAPLTISATAASVSALDITWSFGDGDSGSGPSTTHTYTADGFYTVSATATDALGCSATRTRPVDVGSSSLDLAIDDLTLDETTTPTGDVRITATVDLVNVGSRAIRSADLVLEVQQQAAVSEPWFGELLPGDRITYSFTAASTSAEIGRPDYLCVRAENVNDGAETNLNNNRACRAVQGELHVSSPIPNPTEGPIRVDVVSRSERSIDWHIVDGRGKRVAEGRTVPVARGLTPISIDAGILQQGTYHLIVRTQGEDILRRFMVRGR